jgi:hypothetical protein
MADRCRLLGTSADISAQLCHSDLRLQAAFLVMFPHSDWTMMPQMVSLLMALTQIVVKINFKSDIEDSRDKMLWFLSLS